MELAEQVDNIVGLATAARARGDHQAALTQFSAARDLAPHNAWLHLDVATALRALGRLDEAEASCRQILTFQPEFAAAHRTLGVIARDRKDHQAALACFEMARQFGPSDQWTAFEIANEYLTLERYDEAIAQYNATLALKPDFPEPHRQIGIIQRGRGDHQAALAQFSAARDLAPQNAWFHLDVVTELRVLGRLDEAESSCRQILTFQPEFAAAHRTLGVIARDRKDHQAALACFEVARQYGPTDPWTSFEIANEYRTLGRHDDAIAQYNATLALKPDFPEPHRQIAMIQRARGDHQAALAQFSAARDLAPHNAWFYLDVATELRALGRLDEADASCRQILTFQPEFVAAHRTLGMIARARKDHQAALACFEVARQYGPTDHWTTFEIANEYRTLERYDEAVAQYYATLALKPDFPEPHRQIGIIERVRKNHEAALAQFSAARDLAPHNAWFHLDVAAELRVLGRLDEAEASCRQILTFQPEFAPAYRTLGMIARDRKDHQAALAYFELARQYGPTDHWTAFEIANEYRTLERYDEAIAHYYATLAIKPDFPEPHRQIGTIERMRGNEAAAIGHFEVALFHLERAATNADGRAVFAPVEVLLLLERLPEAEDRLLKLEGVISDADLLAETHALRAQICGKKRDFVSEVSHRREVARLRPDSTAAWHVLIEKQIALNMPGPALADITEALIHIPDEPDLLIERARALRIAGRTDEAAMQLRDISLDQHTSALTYTRLANEFRSAGMYDEARISAEAAIRVAPHFSWAHLSLAFTILEHDGPIAGLAQFDRELERSPNNQEAIYQVSRLLRENGDAARARDFLIERGETVMSPLRIFEELIVCLCQCDEFDRARALVKAVVPMLGAPRGPCPRSSFRTRTSPASRSSNKPSRSNANSTSWRTGCSRPRRRTWMVPALRFASCAPFNPRRIIRRYTR